MEIRTYSELSKISNFEDRYNYLKLDGHIGEETFGFDRFLNQVFYKSREWKKIRDQIIIRDSGCDLAMSGFSIYGKIIIHHMNPITKGDLKSSSDFLLNPEFLICTSLNTHNAIHYGDKTMLPQMPIVRVINDTCPWKH